MAYIGLTNLHYAIMTAEDTPTTAPTYGTPKRLVGVNSVSRSPETDKVTLYGDNQALATKAKTKKETVTLEIARMPPEDRAALFGHTYASDTKVVSVGANDAPPYVALMYELNTDQDRKELHVLYKGKFSPSQEDVQTEGESLEFGLHSIEGEFVYRTDGTQKKDDTRTIDATDTVTAAAFFASVGGGLT